MKVAATQMACSKNTNENVAVPKNICSCQEGCANNPHSRALRISIFLYGSKEELFELAKPMDNHPIQKMSQLAKQLNVVLPISFLKS